MAQESVPCVRHAPATCGDQRPSLSVGVRIRYRHTLVAFVISLRVSAGYQGWHSPAQPGPTQVSWNPSGRRLFCEGRDVRFPFPSCPSPPSAFDAARSVKFPAPSPQSDVSRSPTLAIACLCALELRPESPAVRHATTCRTHWWPQVRNGAVHNVDHLTCLLPLILAVLGVSGAGQFRRRRGSRSVVVVVTSRPCTRYTRAYSYPAPPTSTAWHSAPVEQWDACESQP